MKKLRFKYLLLSIVAFLLLFWIHDKLSYRRRIGDTRFYLVESMAISKEGKPLVGLYYQPETISAYCGEYMPGFPRTILWNDKYLISKNYDGNTPDIIKYIVINMDSINVDNGEMKDIHVFAEEKDYYNYIKQLNLTESDLNETPTETPIERRLLFLCIFIILIIMYTYHVDSTYITHYIWKRSSEKGLAGSGLIVFGHDSNYTYCWPIIKFDGQNIGIVLLCFDKRMILYSMEDKRIVFYKYTL